MVTSLRDQTLKLDVMSLYHDFATYNCVPLDKLLVSFLGLVICQF